MTEKENNVKIEESSGNVFADLELPHPEEQLVKADLAFQINKLIKSRRNRQ
jgi:predicted XRE-type DNA-binding protein